MQPATNYPLLCAALAYHSAAPMSHARATPAEIIAAVQTPAVCQSLGITPCTGRALLAAENWLAVPANFCRFVHACTTTATRRDFLGGSMLAEPAGWAYAIGRCLAVADWV